MTAVFSIIAAVALSFHGVIGQSACEGEAPLAFTGVKSLVGLPGERIVFIGDDGMLYEIRAGRPVSTGRKAAGSRLDYDGKSLRSLGLYSGVWEIDTETFESRRTISQSGVRWDIAGVRQEKTGHPFSDKCKFVTWDRSRDAMIAYDGSGAALGDLFPLPPRKGSGRIEGFGFLPDTGDLLVATYWPDSRICRFRGDGSQFVGNGWPIRRGIGFLCSDGGRLWHCGTEFLLSLKDNMSAPRMYSVGSESELVGYARQGDLEFIGASQGLYVRNPGEKSFSRRLGGIGRLTALAINDGFVFMSMGEKIRWMYLDGDENEPFASSDRLELRIGNGANWKDRIVDLASDGDGWLKVAAGAAGCWRFRHEPPLEYVNHRKFWTRISSERCESVSMKKPSAKLVELLASTSVPGGFEAGKIAMQGRWIVVEDIRNHRLLRFRASYR